MEHIRTPVHPFTLQPSVTTGWTRAALGVAAPVIERMLGLSALARMYDEATGPTLVDDFPERALRQLGIGWSVPDSALMQIPAEGPLVVVANHPFGAADGLVLLSMVRRVRRDVRLLGNYLLERIPELRPLVLAVNPFQERDARVANQGTVRRAGDWVRRGGALLVFPAGEVANVSAGAGRLIDPRWKTGVARIVADGEAPVLPVYFDGRNSRTFELAGFVHPRLRTALLPRELLRMRGRSLSPVVGSLIPFKSLATIHEPRILAATLRAHTFALRGSAAIDSPRPFMKPVTVEQPSDRLAQEIAMLPAIRRLAEHRTLAAYCATAQEAPGVVAEIGRLREITFRGAGEGTGRSTDLDEFDGHYWHLFLWDEQRRVVVGAYRLGPTDTIAARRGPKGLYTRTLFTFRRRFLDQLGPALELGRSFVRPEYQREFSPLKVLWEGIGRFVALHPRYRRLFGPVSISATYTSASRDLIADALQHPSLRSSLADFVRARRPFARTTSGDDSPIARRLEDVQKLVGDLEGNGCGLPVLLRQYLKLNARVLALSRDPNFSDVLDALLVVDLDHVNRPLLDRYLGRAAADDFLAARHRR
jgi:putative hemolysin